MDINQYLDFHRFAIEKQFEIILEYQKRLEIANRSATLREKGQLIERLSMQKLKPIRMKSIRRETNGFIMKGCTLHIKKASNLN